ncbi:MAG TPA: isoprenylcysteine carboxylmethyltransferase family protein [Pararhizobium sp.]|nr:isoprenylcysteine carboxylmethyltransferase family protein [Pararhizobium sp.]
MTETTLTTARSAGLAGFQRRRRLALGVLLSFAFAALIFCRSWFGYGELHEFIEAAGLSLIGVCVLGRLWATLYIGGRKNAEIVTNGPYSLTRNPLYVFSAIGAAGVGAQTGSIVVALAFGLVTAFSFQIVIRREEAFLRHEFGAAFEAYRHRVPRFLPRLTGFQSGGMLAVDPAKLYATLLDGLVFFAAIPAFEAIDWLQQTGIIPVLFRLP